MLMSSFKSHVVGLLNGRGAFSIIGRYQHAVKHLNDRSVSNQIECEAVLDDVRIERMISLKYAR
jgi:hypothetical protein